MNIALENTEEYVNGQLTNSYGDAFVRGNNGLCLVRTAVCARVANLFTFPRSFVHFQIVMSGKSHGQTAPHVRRSRRHSCSASAYGLPRPSHNTRKL